MKYGCRAHDYGRFEPEMLASVLHKAGYNAAQVALPKAVAGIESMASVTDEQLMRVRSAFEQAGIELSVLSCYQDLSAEDGEARNRAVELVCLALQYQKKLGACQVGSESACRDLTEDEKAAALPRLTDSVLRIVEHAAKIDAVFALEPVFVHTLGTAAKLRRLIEQVADPAHFKVIFDPVNVLTAETVAHQTELWQEWTQLIGGQLAVVHMKDAIFPASGPRVPTALGEGQMDYTVIAKWLHEAYPNAALLRDEVILPAAPADLAYMQRL